MSFITQALLAEVSAEAAASPRMRKNRNFHPADDSICHRLLNAIEPASYVAPHRHLAADKEETMIALSGRIGIVFFHEDGRVSETVALAPAGPTMGVNIPPGTYHSVLGLAPGSVVFEAKAGPYLPLLPEEKAPWAPAEGGPGAPDYQKSLAALFGA